jgi:chorismate-pyruvate lyase
MINSAIAICALWLSGCAPSRLAEFEQLLATQDSATVALGEWCKTLNLADPPLIRAEPVSANPQPSAEIRDLLDVSATEPLGYRHVRLVCGNTVLSIADNWYVPGRLSAEMNQALATTQTPFGKIIASLHFHRDRLSATRGQAYTCPPGTIISHRARLRLPDETPLALVTECYTSDNLDR